MDQNVLLPCFPLVEIKKKMINHKICLSSMGEDTGIFMLIRYEMSYKFGTFHMLMFK